RGDEDLLGDQAGGAVADPASPGGGAACRLGAPGNRHCLRPRPAAWACGAVLEWRHREAAYRHQLAPTGVTLEQLRAAPGGVRVPLQTRHAKHAEPDANGAPRGFATPSRRVELYSQTFLDHGYAPLPDFSEPPVGPVARPDLATR